MLVTDINNLGDTRLDPTESLARSKEDTRRMQKGKGLFLPGQEELEDQELSQGTRLHWQEFLRRLQRANVRLLIRDGAPGNIAIYIPKTREERNADEYDWTKPEWWNDHRYVTGFPKAWLPEYSSITVNERGLAKRELRGWRSVLIALIRARAVGYRDAVREFGEPTAARGWRWHDQLSNYKGA